MPLDICEVHKRHPSVYFAPTTVSTNSRTDIRQSATKDRVQQNFSRCVTTTTFSQQTEPEFIWRTQSRLKDFPALSTAGALWMIFPSPSKPVRYSVSWAITAPVRRLQYGC